MNDVMYSIDKKPFLQITLGLGPCSTSDVDAGTVDDGRPRRKTESSRREYEAHDICYGRW